MTNKWNAAKWNPEKWGAEYPIYEVGDVKLLPSNQSVKVNKADGDIRINRGQ